MTMYLSQAKFTLTAIWKNKLATVPKGDMGYDQYIVPDTVAVELIFSEEQWTQNHPQYLSRLMREIFPTTFFEIGLCAGTKTIPGVVSGASVNNRTETL